MTIEQREQVVKEAESWYGTPYRGWSCAKGCGTDCGQLIYGVYRGCDLLPEIELPTDYSLTIGHHIASTAYVEIVSSFMEEVEEHEVKPGDVVVWKLRHSLAYCHAAIIKSWPDHVIHAINFGGVTASHGTNNALFRGAKSKFFTLKHIYTGEK